MSPRYRHTRQVIAFAQSGRQSLASSRLPHGLSRRRKRLTDRFCRRDGFFRTVHQNGRENRSSEKHAGYSVSTRRARPLL